MQNVVIHLPFGSSEWLAQSEHLAIPKTPCRKQNSGLASDPCPGSVKSRDPRARLCPSDVRTCLVRGSSG